MSKPRDCGPGKSSQRSNQRGNSGWQNLNIKTISNAFQTDTPATLFVPAGAFPPGRSGRNPHREEPIGFASTWLQEPH
jgi:hypothetical protein